MASNILPRGKSWLRAISLLSMDLTAPFYRAMGLGFSQVKEFQQILRTALEPNLSSLVWSVPRDVDFGPVEQVHEAIDREFPAGFWIAFESWFENFFEPEDHGWAQYQLVWSAARSQVRCGASDPLRLKDKSSLMAVFERWQQFGDIDSALRIEKETHPFPLDDRGPWDSRLYNLGRFINDPEVAMRINDLYEAVRVSDPLDDISAVVRTFRFKSFWMEMLGVADPNFIDQLYETAKVRWEQILLKNGSKLPHPKELKFSLPWPREHRQI